MGRRNIFLFVLWPKARSKEAEMIDEISRRLRILGTCEVAWPRGEWIKRFKDFYGFGSSFMWWNKYRKCGRGLFKVVVVEDVAPVWFQSEDSLSRKMQMDSNIHSLKKHLRELSEHSNVVHASMSHIETDEEIRSLFGVDTETFVASLESGSLETKKPYVPYALDVIHKSLKKRLRSMVLRFFAAVRRDSSPKAVFYHDIGHKWTPMGTPKHLFFAHMRLLRPGDMVCFDDGFRGIWDARDELKAANVHPVVFIAPALVGGNGYLTWDEMRTLQAEYGFSFQSHTWSHQTLAGGFNHELPPPDEGRTEQWFRREIVLSKDEIERRLGKGVDSICLPVGHFSDSVLERCRVAGYKYVYSSIPGNLDDGFLRHRCLAQDLDERDFRAVLNGGMNTLAKRYLKMHKTNDK